MTRLALCTVGILAFAFVVMVSSVEAQVNPSARSGGEEVRQSESTVVTSRRSNYIREGPGSFHRLIVVVKKDVPLQVLDEKNGWIRVKLPDDRTGWISRTSIYQGEAAPDVSREELGEQWTTTEATDTEVAAAVRGFQMRAKGLSEGSVEELTAYLQERPYFGEEDVEQFQRPLTSAASSLDLGDLDVELSSYDPSVEEQQVGLAVGARLASKGLVQAPKVRRYLSLMAVHLTEETPYYDWNFDVVIVEGEGPDAFACPGGILVLTRGVFTHFQDEAELAGLLAHEIAHVVRHHGRKEMGEREVKQKADDAFAELDRMTEDEGDEDPYAQAEKDLTQVMRESYERIVNDRLLEYEKEADRIAAAFMAEAGYDPRGLIDAVGHIAALRSSDPDLFDSDYLEVQNIQKRQKHIRSFIDREGAGGGARLPSRFSAYADEVR